MTTHANRGKTLEAAVEEGCNFYKRLGRAAIRKRHARRIWQDGAPIWISKGDVDYSGDAEGRAFYAECKETREDALPLAKLEVRQHQLDKLAAAAERGCMSGLIIGFLPEFSVWWVPYVELREFLKAPWRRSLSRNMCAAWGLQLPVGVSLTGKPLIKFLDGFPFGEKDKAISAVNADRLANPLELELDEPAMPSKRVAKIMERDPFDLLTIAKRAKARGVKGKSWGDR